MSEVPIMPLEVLQEKAAYHYKCFKECMDAICEIDENEAQGMYEWLNEIGGC